MVLIATAWYEDQMYGGVRSSSAELMGVDLSKCVKHSALNRAPATGSPRACISGSKKAVPVCVPPLRPWQSPELEHLWVGSTSLCMGLSSAQGC